MAYATPAEAFATLDKALERVRRLWEPPPSITVSQWAERNRVIPKGSSPRPGPFRAEVFQREIMDAVLSPDIHELIVVKSTQVGWSDAVLNNIVGYFIDANPQPMMLVQPSLDNAKDYGKKRISPMIEATPSLRGKVKVATSRKAGNTLTLKEFPGGFLKLTGANSGKGLRSDPLPIVLFDEADAYPDDVDGEGDPLEIGARRTDAYTDWKILMGSTPAKSKGVGKFEKRWEASDQRRFFVPCPFCKAEQPLQWKDDEGRHRLVYELNEDGDVVPESVGYLCRSCGRIIEERYKQQMLDAGRWVPRFPGRSVVGFHVSALYSPWKDLWVKLAQEWVDAQDDDEALKAFVTLRLGEWWEERGDTVKLVGLAARREVYAAPVPAGVGALVLACDVQDNRVEAHLWGFGKDEESWLVAHEIFWGDPGANGMEVDGSPWKLLEAFRLREWAREGTGEAMPIDVTLIDSGGHHTEAVYDFVTPRQNLRDRVFAVKGVDYHSKPVLVQEGQTKKAKVRLFTIATYAAKDRIFSRLKIGAPGPGFVHLPDWVTDEWIAQLTGEKKITVRDKKTRAKKALWVKTHSRNEALDCKVYALGGVLILQSWVNRGLYQDLGALAESWTNPEARAKSEEPGSSGGTWNRRGSGWVQRW